MFSVPGWSITAPLKTQTGRVQAPSLPSALGASSTKAGDGASKMQKRKREDGDNDAVKAKKPKEENTVEKGDRVKTKKEKGDKKPKTTESADGATNTKASKKEKKQVKKQKITGSNAIDLEAGAAARKERQQQAEKKAQEAAETAETKTIKEKSKKEKKKKKSQVAEEPADNSGTSTSTEDKSEKRSKKSKDTTSATVATPEPLAAKPAPKLTPLQAQMAAKLASARFRHLNETLYTTPSSTALEHFKKNPETFEEYHSGFRQQVDVWPSNPVDGYIAEIKRRGAVKHSGKDKTEAKKGARPLPRTQGLCTIADLGCGDAKLAAEMANSKENINLKILSYDLHSPSPHVTRADIANLPLEDGSVNVAIFCLALMGTNWPDFIDEAYRILHWKGELWVAEIKSRFGRAEGKSSGNGKGKVVEHSVGNRKKKPRSKMSEAEKKRDDALKADEDDALAVEVDGVPTNTTGTDGDETDVSAFIKVLESRGFVLDGDGSEAIERGNKMFVKMRFLKAAQATKGKNAKKGGEGATWKPKGKKFLDAKDEEIDEEKVLKPCVYKLR